MREPCRVCGAQLRGNQCRWLFGACGRKRLAVLLARALGQAELRRDGRAELLCGKCVFLLETVLQCDAEIRLLQEAQAARVHALQGDRDELCLRIRRKYQQNNPPEEEEEAHTAGAQDDGHVLQEGQPSTHPKQECEQGGEEARQQQELSSRSGGGEVVATETRETSQGLSRVGRARTGWHGSLGSLSEGRPGILRAHTLSHTQTRVKSREYSALVHQRKVQAWSLSCRRSSSLQSLQLLASDYARAAEGPSVLSDWLQLVKSTQPRPIPHTRVSKIPVLTRPRSCHSHPAARRNTHPITAQVLKEMEEEFNDEYTPIVVEV